MYCDESFFYEIKFVPLINDRVIYWKALLRLLQSWFYDKYDE